jgi:hypothetical protein
VQNKKLLQILSLIAIATTVTLTLATSNSATATRAAPSFQEPPRYNEFCEILDDGTIIVTRVKASPEQIRATSTCTQPAPALLEPVNGSQIGTLIPDYWWEQVSNQVFEYSIEVSPVPDFSTLDNSATFLVSNPSAGSPYRAWSRTNLHPDTTYYWRVASVCEDTGEEGPFSPAFSFRSAPPGGVILPAPDLQAPDDGAAVGSTRVTFSLGSVNGAAKYQYRFFHSSTSDWDSWFRWMSSARTLTTAIFDPQETIYWRGAAVNDYAVGTPSVQRSFVTPPIITSTQISPSNGGTLVPDPANISIQFPPGAVTAQTTLSYTLQPEPSRSLANFRFAGRAFTLEAFDSNGRVTTFNKPFTITIVYDAFDLIAAGIGDPSRLNVVFWNGSQWARILPCEGCSIDTVNQRVTVVVDHLTEFALVDPTRKVYLPIVLK